MDKEQRNAIAYLAKTARDDLTGTAPRWDIQGVLNAVDRVRHIDVKLVTEAALRAARNPEIRTPGMIGDPSSWCYEEPVREVTPPMPETLRPEERCQVCGLSEYECRRRSQINEHEFVPDLPRPRDVDLSPVVGELKHAAHEQPPRWVREKPAPPPPAEPAWTDTPAEK